MALDNPYQPPPPLEAAVVEEPPGPESAATMGRAVAVFRGLLALYVVLVVLGTVASFVGEAYLPAELQAYLDAEPDFGSPAFAALLVAAGLGLLSLGVMLAGWLGMFLFWRPSRWLFLAGHVMLLVATVFVGPVVMNPIENTLAGASQLAAGAILGIAFFSPLRTRFVMKKSVRERRL